MAHSQLKARRTNGGGVEEISRDPVEYLLSIPAGPANQYRLAQLDDYTHLSRGNFPLLCPAQVHVSARASSNSIPGTWGFGLWNDPFGLSLGFGGSPWRLPALPNTVWFFGASEQSYLSFKSTSQAAAANGFLAQSFRAPRFHPLLAPAGLVFPFSRKATRRLLGNVIAEDAVRLNVDVTEWHRYCLDWRVGGVSFLIDDALVFESSVSPRSPLGLVIWIDNQFAAFTPEGKIGFGVLENPEPAWLEVKEIDVQM